MPPSKTFSSNLSGNRLVRAETAAELDALWPAILDRGFKGEL